MALELGGIRFKVPLVGVQGLGFCDDFGASFKGLGFRVAWRFLAVPSRFRI